MAKSETSRRLFLRRAAAAGSGAALATVAGSLATSGAAAAVTPPGRATKSRLAWVVAVAQNKAEVDVDGVGRWSNIPLHGFPNDYVPEVGERVVVTDRLGAEGKYLVMPLVRTTEAVERSDSALESDGAVLRDAARETSRLGLTNGSRVRAWLSSNRRFAAERVMWIRDM